MRLSADCKDASKVMFKHNTITIELAGYGPTLMTTVRFCEAKHFRVHMQSRLNFWVAIL